MDPRATTRNNSPGWMDQIPGYRGYKQKELRREADRALRMYLAAKLVDQLRKLDDAKLKLLNAGGLAQIALFERASTKLRTLIDTIKTASYGYAGLFDSDAVREPQLDALYAFDQALDGEVDALGAKVDALRAAVEGNQGIGPALDTVQSETDALLARFRTRDEAIQNGQGLPAESPRSVLEAAAPAKPAFLALQQLRLNDAISVGGKDYVIVSREQATVNGTNYLLYRLDSGARAKTLWVGPTERDLAVLDPYTPTVDLFKADEVTLDGDSVRLVNRGFGSVNFDGPSGTRRDVSAQIAVFRSALQVLWAEQMGQETIVLLGLTTDVGSVQTFRR